MNHHGKTGAPDPDGVPVLRTGEGRPELWVIAGVHGDEVEGMACAEEAYASLGPEKGTLVCVPVAHPAALAAGTRRGPDGIDLNRTFPGRPDGQPTERVAHELWRLLQDAAPDAVMTLHSWSRNGSAAPHVEYARGDAAGRELAHALGLPFALGFDWPVGLLPRVAVEHGIPSVELELGGLGAQTQDNLARGLAAVQGAQAWLGMRTGALRPSETQAAERIAVLSGVEGRVRQCRGLGEPVARGEIVAEIRATDGSVLERVVSPSDGWIGVHVNYGEVASGDPIVMLFEYSGVGE